MLNDVLIPLDQELLLLLNGSRSVYFDRLIDLLTTASTWIPLYVALLLMVVKNNASIRQVLFIIVCATLCVLLAGTVGLHITDQSLQKQQIEKTMVARLRPTHDPTIGILVDVVDGYRGGKYGFFSAHAANTMSIAVYFSLLVRHKVFTLMMVGWSLLNCYTRLYLGVHYPIDILVGLTWGTLVGLLIWLVQRRFTTTLNSGFISSQFTSTGYRLCDIDLVNVVLLLIYFYALIVSCWA